MDANRKCAECGTAMIRRAHERTTNVAGVKVTDKTALAFECPNCGEYELSLDELRGYELRAAALVLRDGTRVTPDNVGAIVRFARKAMGLKQVVLAGLLDVTSQTVSRWETGAEPVAKTTQLAILALLDLSITGHDLRSLALGIEADQPLVVPSCDAA